jgi:hypothetical protein
VRMAFDPLAFAPYHELHGRPNVVVDGSPTDGTVVTLTHWPGFATPPGTEADLSAAMVLRYLRNGVDLHSPATLVSNNHFDQDGLAGVYALTAPADALERQASLVDLASAGDFGTFRDRRAARASMVIAAWADLTRTPFDLSADDADRGAALYRESLARLPELLDHPERHRDLWADEDAALAASERLVADGEVKLTEHPDVDLAVFDVPDHIALVGGHRFAHEWVTGLHPMALNNATERFAVLARRGRCYRLTYRYESWVQYRSRPVFARRDLAVLGAELDRDETSGGTWRYDGSGGLAPSFRLMGADESSIAPDRFLARLVAFLASAPPDWDPFPSEG